jgi:hypothetical protein
MGGQACEGLQITHSGEGGDGSEKGDHRRMWHDDYAKILQYLRHLRGLSRHRSILKLELSY